MAARQQKQGRKGMQDTAPRRAAWNTGPRASPTFSPSVQNARLPNGPQSASSTSFPPLSQTNGAQRQDRQQQDRVLNQLSGLTGTTITLSTKTNQRYEGSVLSTSGEGDTTGVTLKDVKELTQPGAPLKDTLFIASTNIETWASGPADAKAPNANGHDSFKTDTDISQKGPVRRERELQAWQPTSPEDASHPSAAPPHTDDMTFGPGSAQGNNSWDQFAVNEKLFGVKAGFDEDAYTTKLDRSAPGFKEREKKAQALANEIMGSTTNNVHVAEERVKDFVGDSGTNEEEKYGAVVRGANAYVPPGARKTNPGAGSASATPKDAPTPTTSTPTGTKPEIPKVSINAPDGSTVAPSTSSGSTSQLTPSATSPGTPGAAGGKPGADPIPAFRSFVSNEKDRLMRKKQALMKNEMDKRMAELVKFSKSFKLKQPIPDDLVPILAKDEEKQRQIKERSTKDAESSHARSIGPLNTLTATNNGAGNGNLGASGSTIIRGAQPPTPASAKPPAAIPEIAKQQAAAAKNGALEEQRG
ncbi:hypothetical protein NLI96_g4251 [Meripilus lineatus]|uniref:LsmAD domain-containing protein n=1 Tax=Meripilus lineatus TaxID=2056292 RepID=A0AAD5V502_9APHY|nr:hypothetical protein NLI96_g4251 [Physisporinus lineatus]